MSEDSITAPVVVAASNEMFAEINKLFGTNKKKEVEGIVIKFGTIRLRIARMGQNNKKFKAVWDRLNEPYAALHANKIDLPDDVQREIIIASYAEAIVMEWGRETPTGYEERPYTKELGIEVFTQEPDFFQFVVNESAKATNFRDKVAEAEEKN